MICSLVERCGMASVTQRSVEAFVGIPFIGHIAHVLRIVRSAACVRAVGLAFVFLAWSVEKTRMHHSFELEGPFTCTYLDRWGVGDNLILRECVCILGVLIGFDIWSCECRRIANYQGLHLVSNHWFVDTYQCG